MRPSLIDALLLASGSANNFPQVQPLIVDNRQSGNIVGSTVALDYATYTGVHNTTTGIVYFRGLRYAEPPLGDLRWRAPIVPPTTKLGNVSATDFANACIQAGQTSVTTGFSEDCLYGNVYIPENTRVDSKLPVVVWFHGSGWQTGNVFASPDLLLRDSAKPMIMVSFAYRLGHFGFLGGSQIKGDGSINAGILDQRVALRWVQKYIDKFGGDHTKVTIWGEPAGGGGIMFHLIANDGNSEGLFRGAMGDSPSLSFVPKYDGSYVEGIFAELATAAGCADTANATALQCLRSLSSSSLALAGARLLSTQSTTIYVFAPMIDDTFLTKRPNVAYSSGAFAKVPLLFGFNTNEGAGWSTNIPDPAANTNTAGANETTVFNFFRGQYNSITFASVDDAISTDAGKLGLYPLSVYNNSITRLTQQMYGEERYMCTAGLIVAAARKAGVVDAYQYHYDNPHLGSNHGSELSALFGPPSNANADDLALFIAMREYCTSFVTGGKPLSKINVTWESVRDSTASPALFLQPTNVKMGEVDEGFLTRCDYWHRLGPEMQT